MLFFRKNNLENEAASFWEHLEALRWTLVRIVALLFVLVILIFGFKDFVFNEVIFKPINSDFFFYKVLCEMANWLHMPALCPDDFNIQLINVNLSGQFIAHITASISIAIVLSVPFLLFEVWRFIAPALYNNEKKNIGWVFISSSVLFYMGAAVSYFVIFPLTIRFLGTYQISELVPNQISIQSYLSTLYILVFAMGLTFEVPILAYFLSRLGIITRETLRSVRNYAVVVILILAAFITPTSDPITLIVVSLPLYILYEVSILVCKSRKVEEEE